MMRVPYSWLCEYLTTDTPPTPTELANRLALVGTEVERVHSVGVPPQPGLRPETANGGGLSYRVGRVVEFEQHPNADRLRLCRVDIGEGEPQQIVCGASNFQTGDTVAVVLPGALLPGGSKLGSAKLRGIESHGMMLSERELELGQGHDGILLLTDEPGVEPGDALAEHLPLSDHVLELEITSNRADCLSILGIAREAATAFDLPLDDSVLDDDAPVAAEAGRVEDHVQVRLEAPDLCSRYMARAFVDVEVGPSPAWLRARLARAGMRAINNVVDITNYVMLLTGQPLHAFDAATVRGGTIVVRRATDGEQMTTLDDVERSLDSEMLVIADSERPAVIAGIMGAADVEVHSGTTSLFLEAACFDGPQTITTAARLGLRSESSSRFEKGLDPVSPEVAMRVASRLLVELAGAKMAAGTIDVQADGLELTAEPVPLDPKLVDEVLGYAIPGEEQARILRALGIEPLQTFDVEDPPRYTIPHWRMRDLTRPIDLVEEVGRMAGLDRVPSVLPAQSHQVGALSRRQRAVRTLQDAAATLGLHETVTSALVARGDHAIWGRSADEVVTIANPMTSERAELRVSVLGGHLEAVRRNRSAGEETVGLFEVTRTYGRLAGPTRDEAGCPTFHTEREVLSLCCVRPRVGDAFDETGATTADLGLAQGYVAALLQRVGVVASFAPFTKEAHADAFLHPGLRSRVVVGGEHAGWVGIVHPTVAGEFDVADPVLAAEISIDRVVAALPSGQAMYRAISGFPAVRQDLAIVVSADVLAGDLVEAARTAGGDLVEQVTPFDRYEGGHLAEGTYSLALRIVLRSPDRTLTDDDATQVREAIVSALGSQFGAVLRG